jgi:hypothetical protein
MTTIGQIVPYMPAGSAYAGATAPPGILACAAHAGEATTAFMMAPPGLGDGPGSRGGRLPPTGGGSDGDGNGGKKKNNLVRIQGTVIPVGLLARTLHISPEEARDFIDARPDFFEIEVRVYRAIPRDESFETFFERQLKDSLPLYHHRLARVGLERQHWFREYLSQQDEETHPVITMLAADLMIAGNLVERDRHGIVTARGQKDLTKAVESLAAMDAKALGVEKRWLGHRLRNSPWKPPPSMFLSTMQEFLPPGKRVGALERFLWLHALRAICALRWRFFGA